MGSYAECDMGQENGESKFHVLIIGAGSVGLLIAQRLKTLDISCTVYEREPYLGSRTRDWNFGIHWAQDLLSECLPENLQEALSKGRIDTSNPLSEKDSLPIYNSETGELLLRAPTPNMLRLRKSKFREVVVEGVDVKYGKHLSCINPSEDDDTVTAIFEDGTQAKGSLLIGADGANSRVRNFLLGPEKAALQPLPMMGCVTVGTLPGNVSEKLRKDIDGQIVISYHPLGFIAFASIHNIHDVTRPETWEWMTIFTWRDDNKEDIIDPVEIRKLHHEWSNKLAEPLRTPCLAAPEYSPIWCDRLGQWPTIAWNNIGGRVTLAGDAAHPMTYHRGQGLNNAVHDAVSLGRALKKVHDGAEALVDSISKYEKELVERGHEAVVSSEMNSRMLLDWSQLKESPMFKYGTTRAK